jgi:hypothetical protein
MDLREIGWGGVDWIVLVYDGVRCRAMVLNLSETATR